MALAVVAGAWTGRPTQAADAVRREWPRGLATPPLTLPALDGQTWSLAAARGRVVLLNFWASWCEPCRDELPSMQALALAHQTQGLDVIAVNFKEGVETIRRYTERTAVSLPILRDADGGASRAWGVRLFPTTVVIGRDGRARYAVLGEIDWQSDRARRWLDDLIQSPR